MSIWDNPNTGHGHVYPRPDGARARCGGPGVCADCSRDLARKKKEEGAVEKVKSLADLEQVLAAALNAHRTARTASEAASRNETAALNALNAAQKALDDRIQSLRAAAPKGSDWAATARAVRADRR